MATIAKTTAYPLALTWDDSSQSVIGLPTGGTAPARTNMTANVFGLAYSVNDLCDFAFQTRHSIAPASDCRLHVHFMFPTAPTVGQKLQWEIYFTYAAPNAAFSAESGPHLAEYTVVAGDVRKHLILPIVSFTLPAPAASCWVQGRVRRVAATANEVSVPPVFGFIDGHMQQGAYGTDGEWS